METIKETEDEEGDILPEEKKLFSNNSKKNLEEFERQNFNVQNLTRKSTFPRNFSTMSFMSRRPRKGSTESVMSSYSRLDFTGSSLQLHLEVFRLKNVGNIKLIAC